MRRITLRELLTTAKQKKFGVGAFNIFNDISIRAAAAAAEKLDAPILLQTSVATVKAFGVAQLAGMVRGLTGSVRQPVLLHLDHCRDMTLAMQCVDAGWDSVMIDMSDKPLAENIRLTAQICEYAHAKGVHVEGELGVIVGVEEDIAADEAHGANFEDSLAFIGETGVDAFAPAIGTAHGLYKKAVSLDYELVEKLARETDTPIVVHGGTGLSDEQFARLIALGASKVNVSTALKYAYIDGIKRRLEAAPDEYNPIKFDAAVMQSVERTVSEHILRFGAEGKASYYR